MDDQHDKITITPAARRFIQVLGIVCVLLVTLEFVIHRHAYSQTEAMPLFFAAYGFIAFIIVVAGGVLLRKLVMRPSDYYQERRQGTRDD